MNWAKKAPAVARALSWAAVVLCLLAQVSDVLHLLLVEHVVCAQHGELIHEGEHAHAEATGQPTDATAFVPSDLEDHGHEHCALWSDRREELTLGAPSIGVALPRAMPSLTPPATTRLDAVLAIPLLFLAPKNSPPLGV
jgi:hypothetical protein